MGLLSKRSVSVGLAFHVAIRLTINFIDLMANRLQRVQAPVVVMITCSYRFNHKSLLVKPVNTHFHYSDYPPWRLYQIAIKFYKIISQRLAITSNWRHISTNIKCENSSWICVPDWKISAVIFLHQNHSLITCSLRKMYFEVQIVVIF